jgi:murein L,D-transpeptidase YafK
MKPIAFILFQVSVFTFLVIAGFTQVPTSPRSKAAVLKYDSALRKEFNEKKLHYGNPVFIRIFKETDELEVWVKDSKTYRLFKTYTICNYSGGLGTKTKQGDGKSPEGFYTVYPSQMNPSSDYWLSFNIGYPNSYDRSHGYTGSAIMVHGRCVSIGCYAMGDEAIEEIWTIISKAFSLGQPSFRIHIFPFRMTEENLNKHADSGWSTFWRNLKDGYDLFESMHIPPAVEVSQSKYFFR